MTLVTLLPLAEAAAFTAGCAVLRARRLDAERVGLALVSVAALLALVLMVRLCPVDPTPDRDPEGPAPEAAIAVLG